MSDGFIAIRQRPVDTSRRLKPIDHRCDPPEPPVQADQHRCDPPEPPAQLDRHVVRSTQAHGSGGQATE
jgi:hypothetical protein